MKAIFILSACLITILHAFEVNAKNCSVKGLNSNHYDTLLIRGQLLLGGKDKPVIGHVAIKDGKIQKVFRNCEVTDNLTNTSKKTFDMVGKILVPGFHDFHVHNIGLQYSPTEKSDDAPGVEAIAKRLLFSGITSYLDMGSDLEKTGSLRQRSLTRKELIPNVFAAGKIFQVKGGHLKSNNIDIEFEGLSEQEIVKIAKSKVKKHIENWNPDVIKVLYDHNLARPEVTEEKPHGFERMPKFIFKALIEEAKVQGKQVISHVGTWQDVEDAVNLGVAAITHIPFDGDTGQEKTKAKNIIRKMAKENVSVITTMVAYMDYGHIHDEHDDERKSDILDHAFLKMVALKDLITSYFDLSQYGKISTDWALWSIDHNKRGYRQRIYKNLLDNKINLITGTDSHLDGLFFGYSLHRELHLMAKFGASPIEALRATTENASKLKLRSTKTGQIKSGFLADLIIYDQAKSPIEKIENSTEIVGLIKNGQWVDLNAISKQLGVDQ